MKQKNKKGFLNLAQKTMAVISASISSLVAGQSKAAEMPINIPDSGTNIEFIFKKELKPKLVLRLSTDPARSMLLMHSSHSSHASHASHYSSSSSYSSYTSPPVVKQPVHQVSLPTVPVTKKTIYKTTYRVSSKPHSNSANVYNQVNTSEYYRVLYKGCAGSDVENVQQLLKDNGYTIDLTAFLVSKWSKV